jgi:hypothetical protein
VVCEAKQMVKVHWVWERQILCRRKVHSERSVAILLCFEVVIDLLSLFLTQKRGLCELKVGIKEGVYLHTLVKEQVHCLKTDL